MPVPTPEVGALSQVNFDAPERIYQNAGEKFQQAGTAIAEVVAGQREADASEGLATELDNETNNWWDETHNAVNAPNVVDVFNVDEERFASAPPEVQALMQEVARQRLAADQGAISGTELKVRHEAKLREYINRYPQLTQELQQVAGATLGYNPLGAHIDQLMETLQGKEDKSAQEWAALDKYADNVGVDMTLKSIDPVGYYTEMMAFARRDTEYEYLNRELQITKVTKEGRNIAEMDRFQKVAGSRIMGQAAGLMGKITRIVQASGIQGKAEFATDVLPSIRNQVTAFNLSTRQSLQRDFPEMSQTQIDAFMSPLEKNFDLVLKSTDPSELATALGLFKTQAAAQVYADHPEVANLEIAANLLKDLPTIPGLIEKSNLAGAFTLMIHNLVTPGVETFGGTGLGIDPNNMTPEDRQKTYQGFISGMTSVLPMAKAKPEYYPVLKRQTLQFFDFIDKEGAKGTGGDEKANKAFMEFWSNPASAPVLYSGPTQPGDAALIEKGVTFATEMLRKKGLESAEKFDGIRMSRVPGNLLDMKAGGGASRPILLNDILEMSVSQQGDVSFKVNWSNAGYDESRIPAGTKSAVDSMVAKAQMVFGNTMSQSVKMIAHMHGSTDYAAAAGAEGKRLKQPILEALMMPNG